MDGHHAVRVRTPVAAGTARNKGGNAAPRHIRRPTSDRDARRLGRRIRQGFGWRLQVTSDSVGCGMPASTMAEIAEHVADVS